MWKVSDIARTVSRIVTTNILFFHAWSGCDTTSATFGHRKTALLKKIEENDEIREISSIMCNPDAKNEEVSKAGIRLFVILYGSKNGESINKLRYAKFMEISSPKNVLDPQKLPPTEGAAYYHSLRVHCQVIIWIKLNVDALDPIGYGAGHFKTMNILQYKLIKM